MKEQLLNKIEIIVTKGENSSFMSNFSFGHNVFKKSSATEMSENICMRERVNDILGALPSLECRKSLDNIISLYQKDGVWIYTPCHFEVESSALSNVPTISYASAADNS